MSRESQPQNIAFEAGDFKRTPEVLGVSEGEPRNVSIRALDQDDEDFIDSLGEIPEMGGIGGNWFGETIEAGLKYVGGFVVGLAGAWLFLAKILPLFLI